MLGAFFDLRDFGFNHCGHGGPGSHRGRWGFEGFMGDFWGGGGPRGRGWKARAGRVFEQDLPDGNPGGLVVAEVDARAAE